MMTKPGEGATFKQAHVIIDGKQPVVFDRKPSPGRTSSFTGRGLWSVQWNLLALQEWKGGYPAVVVFLLFSI